DIFTWMAAFPTAAISLLPCRHQKLQRLPQLRTDHVARGQPDLFTARGHHSARAADRPADRRPFPTRGDAADDRAGSCADAALLQIAFAICTGLARDAIGLNLVALAADDEMVESKRD